MQSTLFAWLCLVGAGFCQMAWTYSLKFLQVTSLKNLRWSTLWSEGWIILGPWLGYLLFGALNSILLSVAMRSLPTTTAFAVWTALSLIFLKAGDVLWLGAGWSFSEVCFLGLITIGIVGLKVFSQPA